MKFLDYSRSSVAETISLCYVVLDQAYIDGSEIKAVKEQADIVWKKVNNFITYLNKSVQAKTNRTN
jgi:four helix bundle protein